LTYGLGVDAEGAPVAGADCSSGFVEAENRAGASVWSQPLTGTWLYAGSHGTATGIPDDASLVWSGRADDGTFPNAIAADEVFQMTVGARVGDLDPYGSDKDHVTASVSVNVQGDVDQDGFANTDEFDFRAELVARVLERENPPGGAPVSEWGMGPGTGTGEDTDGDGTPEFDCCGLYIYCYRRALEDTGVEPVDRYLLWKYRWGDPVFSKAYHSINSHTLGTINATNLGRNPAASQVEAGDLMFYEWHGDGQIDHTVIYLGGGPGNNSEVIMASSDSRYGFKVRTIDELIHFYGKTDYDVTKTYLVGYHRLNRLP